MNDSTHKAQAMIETWQGQQETALIEVFENSSKIITYDALYQCIQEQVRWLKQVDAKSVALLLDNSAKWVIYDLACLLTQTLCTPIPTYFSNAQTEHALSQSQADWLITESENIQLPPTAATQLPNGTQKITFTSGSTGSPKGVCLSVAHQLTVADSLRHEIGLSSPTFLSLLPLPTLLENVAGIYGTLMAGGKVILANAQQRGFKGSRLHDPERMLALFSLFNPNVVNLVPELLLVLVGACQKGWIPPHSLQFVAVGGSRVSAQLLAQAQHVGLPVFQGYGLSECASVVTLNTPSHHNINSAGKPLPHLTVTIENGEAVVQGNTFLGYAGQPDTWYKNQVYTGDLARWDQGSLVIEGRKKNLIINSFGRNIAPEWPESLLMATGKFKQAFVFGDAKPALIALLTPVDPTLSETDRHQTLARVNAQLPDYAQIKHTLHLGHGLSPESGLVTDNFRPKRRAIESYFQDQINALYAH